MSCNTTLFATHVVRQDPKCDLYFGALVKYSAVPVHPRWKAWLHKIAVGKNEIESLTAHCMRGIKISLNDENLAEDIAGAWKKGKLKKDRDFLLFQAEFDSYATPI